MPGKLMIFGKELCTSSVGTEVSYSNAASKLAATNAQDAIDEVSAKIKNVSDSIKDDIVLSKLEDVDGNLTYDGKDVTDSANLKYSNAASTLSATNAQDAIDEVDKKVKDISLKLVTTADEVKYNGIASGLEATDVKAAIDEVNSKVEASPSNAEELPYDNATSKLAATNAQAAIDEVKGSIPPVVSDLSESSDGKLLFKGNAIGSSSGEFTGNASDVTYNNTTSGLTATNTQTAIDEVNKKVNDIDQIDTAEGIKYNNTTSGMAATNVQDAIDYINTKLKESGTDPSELFTAPFGASKIEVTRNGVTSNELWILSNAKYDETDKHFKRLNLDNSSFGIQYQASGSYPGEEEIDSHNQAIGIWRAIGRNQLSSTAEKEALTELIGYENEDGSVTEFATLYGWNNCCMIDSYGGQTIGGAGFEIDGNGIYPYSRVTLSKNKDTKNIYNGTLWNLYHQLSKSDNSEIPGLFYGFEAPIDITNNKTKILDDSNYANLDKSDFVVKKVDESGIAGKTDILRLNSTGSLVLDNIAEYADVETINTKLSSSSDASISYPEGYTKDNSQLLEYYYSTNGVDIVKKEVALGIDYSFTEYGVYLVVDPSYTNVVIVLARIKTDDDKYVEIVNNTSGKSLRLMDNGKLLYDGNDITKGGSGGGSFDGNASDVVYDNATSGLTAINTQAAIDEVNTKVEAVPSNADELLYDNTTSGMTATTVKAAIDELKSETEKTVVSKDVTYDNTASGLEATDVKAAIDEVNAKASNVTAPEASAVKYDNATSGLSATNTQDAISEVKTKVDSVKKSVDELPAVITKANDIEYDNATSGLTAVNTQAAIDEVNTKVEAMDAPTSKNVSYDNATSGMTATNMQQAIDEMDIRLDGFNNPAATSVSYSNSTSGLSADNAQAAIDALNTKVGTNADVANKKVEDTNKRIDDLPDIITDASGISYDNTTSEMAATNTQAAIDEIKATLDTLGKPGALDANYDNSKTGMKATTVQDAIDEGYNDSIHNESRNKILLDSTSYKKDGLTFTLNKEKGTVTLNGTTTFTASFEVYDIASFYPTEAGFVDTTTSMLFNGNSSKSTASNANLMIANEAHDVAIISLRGQDSTAGVGFSFSNVTELAEQWKVCLKVYPGTYTDFIFYPMMRIKTVANIFESGYSIPKIVSDLLAYRDDKSTEDYTDREISIAIDDILGLKTWIELIPKLTADDGNVLMNAQMSPYLAYKAFSGTNADLNDSWVSSGNGTKAAYIGYKFTDPIMVNKITMQNRNESAPRAIKAFMLQGSNDSTTWNDIQEFENPSSGTIADSNYVVTKDYEAYKAYRIFVTAVYDTSYVGVGMLQFYS